MERTKSALRFFVLAVLLVSALVRAEGIDGIDPNAANTTPPGRLVTSILWFENKADPQEEHWGHAIKGFLGNQFGEVQTIQLRGGINYARTELGLQKGSALNAEQARRIGEIVQAQRVIWGSYQHQDDKWQVTVYLLNVATGQMLDPLTTASTDWYNIRDTMTEHILKQLKIKPTPQGDDLTSGPGVACQGLCEFG